MNIKYISGVGIFLVLPAFAGARLPAVNMAAGAISARAQYGAAMQNANAQPRTISASKLVPVSTDAVQQKRGVVSRGTNVKKKSISK